MGIHHGATEATLFFCFSPFLFLCGSMVNKSWAGSAGPVWLHVECRYDNLQNCPGHQEGIKGILAPRRRNCLILLA